MDQFFEINLGIKATLLEWIECFFKFCNLSEITTKELNIRNEPPWCRSKNQAWSRQLQKCVEIEAHTREENRHQWRYSTDGRWWKLPVDPNGNVISKKPL